MLDFGSGVAGSSLWLGAGAVYSSFDDHGAAGVGKGVPLSMEEALFVEVAQSGLHGHGCFTTREVAAGEEVARSRVLVFPPEESELLGRTRVKHYLFYVRDGVGDEPPYHTALAMGPVSFCNHSDDPNCDFSVDEAAAEVVLTARRKLRRNEEITIDYGDYAETII